MLRKLKYSYLIILSFPILTIGAIIYSIDKVNAFTELYRPMFSALVDIKLAIQAIHLDFEEIGQEGNNNLLERKRAINNEIGNLYLALNIVTHKNNRRRDFIGKEQLELKRLTTNLMLFIQLSEKRLDNLQGYTGNKKLDQQYDNLYVSTIDEIGNIRNFLFDESEREMNNFTVILSVIVLVITLIVIILSILYFIFRRSELDANKLLSDSKKMFQTLFDNSYDGLLLIKDGYFVDCNQSALNMLGCGSVGQLLNMEPHEISPEYQPDGTTSREKAEEMIQMCVENGHHQFDWVHRKCSGEDFWCAVVLTRLEVNNETLVHVSWRDITVKKRLTQELMVATEQANQSNREKTIFLANMSHELRTPMHGILSFSNFGITKCDTADRGKIKRYFENIQSSGRRLLTLLNDLLDLSKFEANKVMLDIRSNDLVEAFKTCYNEQLQSLEDKNLNLNITHLNKPVAGHFDRNKIMQVMTNLLSNAINYSEADKNIFVTIKKTASEDLLFSIRDEGVGIPDDEKGAIFDPFIQSSKTRSNAGGTGLGLAICREIINSHGGKIWAENGEDGGAILSFKLPRFVTIS
ncbi:MAG: PAS domain-containing sensor histidine kinase [Gammaproteobacteria bacterium]|nr:PAS domain-containing sensor histidine kinase [Gammaproteobacteria bacterium]MDH5629849.1 PAS domain-containing sensor histidine kinase [Gammaproteobacteria bacterium]